MKFLILLLSVYSLSSFSSDKCRTLVVNGDLYKDTFKKHSQILVDKGYILVDRGESYDFKFGIDHAISVDIDDNETITGASIAISSVERGLRFLAYEDINRNFVAISQTKRLRSKVKKLLQRAPVCSVIRAIGDPIIEL